MPKTPGRKPSLRTRRAGKPFRPSEPVAGESAKLPEGGIVRRCGTSESTCCCGSFPFCRCPVWISAEMAEFMRRPPAPLKIPIHIPVTRIEEE